MNEIRKLLKKFYTSKFIASIIGFPINCIQFLINKELVIVPMTNQPRISLWVSSTEYQLRRKKKLGKKLVIIFLNHVPLKYINKYLYNDLKNKSLVINIDTFLKEIISSFFIYLVSRTNPKNVYFYDTYDIFNKLPKNFYINNNSIKLANQYLKKAKINLIKPLVVLNIREHEYLYKIKVKKNILIQADKNYYYRNQNISIYNKTIVNLLKNNYTVIKTGSKYSQKIKINDINYFDYSQSSIKNDLMDLYFFYKSEFAIIGASGSWAYATIFDKPIVYTGMYWPFNIPSKKNDLFIMGKYFDESQNTYLSIKEIHKIFKNYNINDINNKLLDKLKIKFINNSDDEIMDVCEEMSLRIHNNWQETEEDINYQKNFRKIFGSTINKNKKSFPNIGSKFIKKNKYLLN
ncbi:MAG: hypothetical protein CMA12_08640 [Euryarchaeota archaeon]|nr:hypothetical protein [Euryarchaeota archaeon]